MIKTKKTTIKNILQLITRKLTWVILSSSSGVLIHLHPVILIICIRCSSRGFLISFFSKQALFLIFQIALIAASPAICVFLLAATNFAAAYSKKRWRMDLFSAQLGFPTQLPYKRLLRSNGIVSYEAHSYLNFKRNLAFPEMSKGSFNAIATHVFITWFNREDPSFVPFPKRHVFHISQINLTHRTKQPIRLLYQINWHPPPEGESPP
jgi:hypothetical protein